MSSSLLKTRITSNLSIPSTSSKVSGTTTDAESLPQNCGGKLVATILSTYELPNDLKPTSVKLTLSGMTQSVSTGPPQSRHKEKNAYKFVASKDTLNGDNELVINAPLSQLHSATALFQVAFDGLSPDLVCEVDLASAIFINETKWLILNLSPQSAVTTDEASTESSPQPTLRLKLALKGDYRAEISFIVATATSYFKVVDNISGAADSSFRSLTKTLPSKLPPAKFLLIPVVPIATAIVALSPVLLGVLVVGLPFFLPFLVLILTVAASGLGIFSTLYFSTAEGRGKIAECVAPIYTTMLMTPSGQRCIYNTGPRPTPVQMARLVVPDEMITKLFLSLLIDFIGSSSYLLPVVGEAFDLAWAPFQTVLVAAMYDDTTPSLKYLSFAEEILPFTDLVPTATMGWLKEFAPTLLEQSKGVTHELGVVLKRERAGLKTVGLASN